jgi:hypothetical protein
MTSPLCLFAASVTLAAGLLQPAQAAPADHVAGAREVGLASTVLTFEGGLVGIQPFLHFTPLQLRGDLCAAPSTCQPVNYPAWPLGQRFNELGADRLIAAVDATDGPVTLLGHSQGGQVIYAALRRWAADPATAPDPDRVSWVSIGNPENNVGGRMPTALPADSPYPGTEVIRQYDGWADWPTDTSNLVAVLNAAVGMSTTHVFGYFDVDLDDPNNIRYTPDTAGGIPGKITYVFVPSPMLPLVSMTGLLAPLLNPVLDPILRPIVEAGYQRPFELQAPAAAAVSSARAASEPTTVGEVPAPDTADPDRSMNQNHRPGAAENHRPGAAENHRRGAAENDRSERLGVVPTGRQAGAVGRAAASQRVPGQERERRADHTGPARQTG